MITYSMQSFIGDQAVRAESKSHDHIKKMFGKEMDVIMSSTELCRTQVVLTGLDRFEIQPFHRDGNRYLEKYVIKSMKVENKKDIGFGVKQADFVVTLGVTGSESVSSEFKVSRPVAYSDGENFQCGSIPDKNKECLKIGAKIVDGRCTICETLGGIWRRGECRI